MKLSKEFKEHEKLIMKIKNTQEEIEEAEYWGKGRLAEFLKWKLRILKNSSTRKEANIKLKQKKQFEKQLKKEAY